MNNQKIKKNRGGKRLGWDRLIRLGYYRNAPPLTEALLADYLYNIFKGADENRHNNREIRMWVDERGLMQFDIALKAEVKKWEEVN